MSVLGQEPSQGRAWDREVPAVRPRDWLSGQIRPGPGCQKQDRNPSGRPQGPRGDPDRSTGPIGLLPWARIDFRAWGICGRYRAA